MPRSLRVDQKFIHIVKDAVYHSGFTNQRLLAEDLGLALSTVSNFLNGKPVDLALFGEICRKLSLDVQQIAAPPVRPSAVTQATYSRSNSPPQAGQYQADIAAPIFAQLNLPQIQPDPLDFTQSLSDIPSVAFSSDGKWLAAREPNGTIQIWDWRNGECLKILQSSGQ